VNEGGGRRVGRRARTLATARRDPRVFFYLEEEVRRSRSSGRCSPFGGVPCMLREERDEVSAVAAQHVRYAERKARGAPRRSTCARGAELVSRVTERGGASELRRRLSRAVRAMRAPMHVARGLVIGRRDDSLPARRRAPALDRARARHTLLGSSCVDHPELYGLESNGRLRARTVGRLAARPSRAGGDVRARAFGRGERARALSDQPRAGRGPAAGPRDALPASDGGFRARPCTEPRAPCDLRARSAGYATRCAARVQGRSRTSATVELCARARGGAAW
jgi:hypothetical protein